MSAHRHVREPTVSQTAVPCLSPYHVILSKFVLDDHKAVYLAPMCMGLGVLYAWGSTPSFKSCAELFL